MGLRQPCQRIGVKGPIRREGRAPNESSRGIKGFVPQKKTSSAKSGDGDDEKEILELVRLHNLKVDKMKENRKGVKQYLETMAGNTKTSKVDDDQELMELVRIHNLKVGKMKEQEKDEKRARQRAGVREDNSIKNSSSEGPRVKSREVEATCRKKPLTKANSRKKAIEENELEIDDELQAMMDKHNAKILAKKSGYDLNGHRTTKTSLSQPSFCSAQNRNVGPKGPTTNKPNK